MIMSVLSAGKLALISFVAFVLLSPVQTAEAFESIVISGHISTDQNVPGPVLMTIRNDTLGIAWTFLTDENGAFRLEGVPEGRYMLAAHHQGAVYTLPDLGMLTTDKDISHRLSDSDFTETIHTNAELLSALPQERPALDILEYQCVQCHGLEMIIGAPRAPDEWRATAHRMAERVPTPPAGEIEAVSEYLARHFTEVDKLPALYGKREYLFEPGAIMVQLDLPVASAKPHEIALGPDGRIWVFDFSVTNEPGEKNLFQIDPHTLEQNVVSLAVSKRGGIRSIAFDEKKVVWMAMLFDNVLLRMRDLSEKPDEFTLPPGTWPHSVAIDQEKKVWVTGMKSDRLLRLDPETGKVDEIAIPSKNTMLYGLAVQPETIWYTGLFLHRLGAYDVKTGRVREFAPPEAYSSPRYIKVVDGKVWVAFFAAGKLGRFDPEREEFDLFTLGHPKSGPYDLEVDASGNIWYTDFNRDAIGVLDPATGAVKEFTIPLQGHVNPTEMTFDNQGRIWFSENAVGRVSFLDPNGLPAPGVYVHRDK